MRAPRRRAGAAGRASAALVKERFQGTIELREYAKFSDCVAALDRSEVDAVTTDDVILAGFAAASLIGLLILGLVPAPGGVIGGTVFIVGASIALAVVAGATLTACGGSEPIQQPFASISTTTTPESR